MFQDTKTFLEQLTQGYCLPEPYFHAKMSEAVETLMKCLKDPTLPLFELQELISMVSGRIPSEAEKAIRKLMATYASNITSVLCQFPSQQVSNSVISQVFFIY